LRAVAPGVVGSALDKAVPGAKQYLVFIQDRVDFSGKHDRAIDGVGPVHPRMASPGCVGGLRASVARTSQGQTTKPSCKFVTR